VVAKASTNPEAGLELALWKLKTDIATEAAAAKQAQSMRDARAKIDYGVSAREGAKNAPAANRRRRQKAIADNMAGNMMSDEEARRRAFKAYPPTYDEFVEDIEARNGVKLSPDQLQRARQEYNNVLNDLLGN